MCMRRGRIEGRMHVYANRENRRGVGLICRWKCIVEGGNLGIL